MGRWKLVHEPIRPKATIDSLTTYGEKYGMAHRIDIKIGDKTLLDITIQETLQLLKQRKSPQTKPEPVARATPASRNRGPSTDASREALIKICSGRPDEDELDVEVSYFDGAGMSDKECGSVKKPGPKPELKPEQKPEQKPAPKRTPSASRNRMASSRPPKQVSSLFGRIE